MMMMGGMHCSGNLSLSLFHRDGKMKNNNEAAVIIIICLLFVSVGDVVVVVVVCMSLRVFSRSSSKHRRTYCRQYLLRERRYRSRYYLVLQCDGFGSVERRR